MNELLYLYISRTFTRAVHELTQRFALVQDNFTTLSYMISESAFLHMDKA